MEISPNAGQTNIDLVRDFTGAGSKKRASAFSSYNCLDPAVPVIPGDHTNFSIKCCGKYFSGKSTHNNWASLFK